MTSETKNRPALADDAVAHATMMAADHALLLVKRALRLAVRFCYQVSRTTIAGI